MGCVRCSQRTQPAVYAIRTGGKRAMAFRAFVAWVLFTSAAIAAEHQLRVLTSSDPIKGELVSVDAKNIVLKTADGNVTKPLAQVLQLDLEAPAQPSGNYTQVELT